MAISVALAIVLGLIASFIQSLGLTIQRKSHLQNETLPTTQRRTEWRRKLWLVGFVIFISANIGGTVFQIGALPIVMLAPLGAVSLLFNALLATFILDDFLSKNMVGGTLLIAAGAVLIGYFGVVQEEPHSLDELLALYARPAFIVFASIFTLAFVSVLLVAHLTEWSLNARLASPAEGKGTSSGKKRRRKRSASASARLQRRWSAPSLAPVAEVSESASGIATPIIAVVDEAARRGVVVGALATPDERRHLILDGAKSGGGTTKGYGALDRRGSGTSGGRGRKNPDTEAAAASAAMSEEEDRRTKATRLGLSVAYGGASGTLSGACLLLAKSGIELLVLTLSGHNQFGRWQSWMLVIVMLVAAVLQLWYLNKSLKMADPTLVCPLAFCFYNTSSIMLGLVYFNQLGALSAVSILAVIMGTAVLLTGVWLVSMHGNVTPECLEDAVLDPEEAASSGIEASESEGLLANAAGIAGPHLPPISPTEAVESPPSSPSRCRTRSGSIVGGLGMALPASPDFSRMHFGSIHAALEEVSETSSVASSSTAAEPEHAHSHTHSQLPRTIYTTLLERGLQIGISVSSPGFQVRSFTPHHSRRASGVGGAEAEARAFRRPRRALSEGDVLIAEVARDAVESSEVAVEEGTVTAAGESEGAPQDPASSAWANYLRTPDTAGLTARLQRLMPRRSSATSTTQEDAATSPTPPAKSWFAWARR